MVRRDEVPRLLRSIVKILEAIKKQAEAAAEEVESRNNAQIRETASIRPEPRLSSEIRERADARTDGNYKFDWRWWSKFAVEILGLIGIGIYALITYQQWRATIDTLKEIHAQTVDEHRALLILDRDPESTREQIKIPIINRGHVAAKVISVYAEYLQRITYGTNNPHVSKTSTPTNSNTVGPGQEYSVIITLPDPAPQFLAGKGEWSVIIHGSVAYDEGFGNKDTLSFCVSLNPQSHLWTRGCGLSDFIDFGNKHPLPNKNH